MKFKVNVGYDGRGRARNRYFQSLDAARRFCDRYMRRFKIVLSIECPIAVRERRSTNA